MLQVYIDESASELGDKPLVFAGYAQSIVNWEKFSEDWSRVLRSSPSIRYLHMVEAQNLRGEFRGWDAYTRDIKLIQFGKVIRKYHLWSVQCSINRAEYESLVKSNAPYNLRTPYFSCFCGILTAFARFHEQKGISQPVDFIFDEQNALGQDAAMWYGYIKTINPRLSPLLGDSLIFRDDKQVLPLQATDMLAWHVRREMENRTTQEYFPAKEYLRRDGEHMILEIPKDELFKLSREMSKIPGIEYTKTKSSWRAAKPELSHRLSLGLGPPPFKGHYLYRARKWITTVIDKIFSSFYRKP